MKDKKSVFLPKKKSRSKKKDGGSQNKQGITPMKVERLKD